MKRKKLFFSAAMLAIFIIIGLFGIQIHNPTKAMAAERSWYGWCYDGDRYLSGVSITIQHVQTHAIYYATSNAQGYYEAHVDYSGQYHMMAIDTGERTIVEYDTLPSLATSKRHDFDFTNMPY